MFIHIDVRGQVFEIDGKKIFTFGGASSHDISGGILETEDPDFKKKKRILDKGYAKLYNDSDIVIVQTKFEIKVRYILKHYREDIFKSGVSRGYVENRDL